MLEGMAEQRLQVLITAENEDIKRRPGGLSPLERNTLQNITLLK
jgi:hypothetical protein